LKIPGSFFQNLASPYIYFSSFRFSSFSYNSSYQLSFNLLTALLTIWHIFLYSIQSSLFLIFYYKLNCFFLFATILWISSFRDHVSLFSGILLLVSSTTSCCILNTGNHYFPNLIYIYLNIPHSFFFYFFYNILFFLVLFFLFIIFTFFLLHHTSIIINQCYVIILSIYIYIKSLIRKTSVYVYCIRSE
jgi:hypothetical protein